MIEYHYIYLINKKFSLEPKNIYIFSVLEDALSAKCIIFHFPWNLIMNKKNCKRGRQKFGFFCINSSKIYKQIPEEKLNYFKSSVISLLFLNINKNLWRILYCIFYYK